MFASTEPADLAEADALARHGDGVVVDVSGLFGKASVEAGLLEALLAGAPGPELVAVLAAVEDGALTESEALTVAQTWERVGRWVAARQHTANLRLAGPAPARTGSSNHLDLGVEEVRVGLGLSPGQADRRVAVARELATRLPLTAAALEAGEISTGHVAVLVDLTADRCAEVVSKVEDHVLVRAPHQGVAAFKRCVRRALIRFDPLGEALTHLQAAARRDVVRYDHPDSGLTTILATLPVLDGAIVWNTLDACARRDRTHDKTLRNQTPAPGSSAPDSAPDAAATAAEPAGPPGVKTLGAYRADTLLRWAQEDLAHTGAPRPQRRPVEVQVVIDAPTLLSMADHPAEIPGYGPLPAPIARLLTQDAHWRRFVTDPVTGHLLDYGHTVYAPPPALRDYVTARDRTCTAPHCQRPATHTQLDHLDPFPRKDGKPHPHPRARPPGPVAPRGPTEQHDQDDQHRQGGTTSSANLRPECTWHHLLKTHHGWTAQPRPDTSTLWTSPAGRTYLVPPTPVLPE